MSKQYDQIIAFLDSKKAKYDVIEHKPVITSAEATKETGIPPEQGAKALVLKAGDRFILCVVRGTNKLDYKKVRKLLGERKLRFATPDEVQEVMGVEIGACYPFGIIPDIEMLVDQTIAENDEITFSPGVHDKHIHMKWDEYQRAMEPKLADITV